MFDGFADRREIATVPKCCRTADIPQFPGQKGRWRNSRLRHFLVTEELILRVAQVMALQVRISAHHGASVGRGFQPGALTFPGHIETNGPGNRKRQLPFGVKGIRLGKHAAVQLHFGHVAFGTADPVKKSFAICRCLPSYRSSGRILVGVPNWAWKRAIAVMSPTVSSFLMPS